jgi:hypothetical protein
MRPRVILGVCAAIFVGVLGISSSASTTRDDDHNGPGHVADEVSRIVRGFALSPVRLDLRRKNPALVGLGSYIVNAQGGCNDCHTSPPFAEGGDPHLGQPKKINAARYLAGGTPFGPPCDPTTIFSKNLTPDEHGRPAGLTFEEFLTLMRTGRNPHNPDHILQIMPWPVYGEMTRHDLRAVYEFLSAIPSRPSAPIPPPFCS